jgi:hypothetical protein
MKHLSVGVFVLAILIISIRYKVVKVDVKLLHKNVWNIAGWIANTLLGSIITYWFQQLLKGNLY